MAEKVEHKSPYRQFSEGQVIPFILHTLNPDGSVCLSDKQITVDRIKGGGFFGRVLIPKAEEFVIKTSVPDAWHDLWRRINWNFKDFPSQVNETQAKLDYLASNLIADVIPVATNGRFRVPHSLGYTKLANGYAQVVEKMHGRPPRYDTSSDEFREFRKSQQDLRWLGYFLGFEQAAQIHEENPFGMANLWRDDGKNLQIWLDTLPAIPHKGKIWPFFNFRFHQDVRDWFYPPENGPQQLTFNKIHTDKLLNYVTAQRHRFTDETYQQVLNNIKLYEELWKQKQLHVSTSKNIPAVVMATSESARDFIPKVVKKIGSKVAGVFRVIKDPKIIALSGIENAADAGIISEEELNIAKSNMGPEMPAIRTAAIIHQVWGNFIGRAVEFYSYSTILGLSFESVRSQGFTTLVSQADSSTAISLIAAFAAFKAGGGLFRMASTELVAKKYGANLSTQRRLSGFPFIGDNLSLVAQIGVSSRNSGDGVWHYFIRNFIAQASSILPDGGWGTEREGRWWQKFGKKIETLGTKAN